MNVLHMQLSGGFGGIATLSREINRYSNDNNYFVFLFEGGCVADELQDDGAVVYVLNSSHIFVAKAKKQYLQICMENNIDVLVSHTGCFMEFQIILYLKKKLPSLKVIMYEHCNMSDAMGTGWKRKVNLFLYRKAFKIADAGVAISKYVKTTAVKIEKKDSEKIRVIYNGIDINKFHYVERERTEQMRLIYVGRIVPEKGCKCLIEAFHLLPENVNVSLTLVGDGEEKEACEKYVEKLNLQHKVTFLGQRRDIPDLLAKADAFVHPAICEEGFGLTIVEGLSTGLPCIAFEKGAIKELIEPELNGFYSDDTTSAGMAELIKKLYGIFVGEGFDEMAKNASKSASKFDIKNTVIGLHNLYIKL